MVGVRVGQNDDVEPLATPGAKQRQHRGRTGVDRTSDDTARIDEPGASVGKVEKRRVALAYVDCREAKDARRVTGAPARNLDDGERTHEPERNERTQSLREPRTLVAENEKRGSADGDEHEVKAARLGHAERKDSSR